MRPLWEWPRHFLGCTTRQFPNVNDSSNVPFCHLMASSCWLYETVVNLSSLNNFFAFHGILNGSRDFLLFSTKIPRKSAITTKTITAEENARITARHIWCAYQYWFISRFLLLLLFSSFSHWNKNKTTMFIFFFFFIVLKSTKYLKWMEIQGMNFNSQTIELKCRSRDMSSAKSQKVFRIWTSQWRIHISQKCERLS